MKSGPSFDWALASRFAREWDCTWAIGDQKVGRFMIATRHRILPGRKRTSYNDSLFTGLSVYGPIGLFEKSCLAR